MKAPTFSPSVEYPAAARRLGMALLLLAAYGWYGSGSILPRLPSLRSPAAAPAAGAPGSRHVEMFNAADRVRGSGAGGIVDESEKRAVLEEAAEGRVGPATRRAWEAAEKDGTLDVPLYDGRSLRQLRAGEGGR